MSDKTRIEWTEATWNPVTGCSKVSAGCKYCYAERDWARLSANPATRYHGRTFTDVRCHGDVLEMPLRWKRPRRIFVNSMSDLFHPDVPDQFIADVFGIMAATPWHTYQVLTKRPERAAKLLADSAFYNDVAMCMALYSTADSRIPIPNVWLGVSVEDQAAAGERIPLLLQTPAAVRWISAEPLLGPVSFRWAPWHDYSSRQPGFSHGHLDGLRGIDWVVVGGESGPKARPMHPDWARGLRDQCAEAGVPFLFKQWGEWIEDDYSTVKPDGAAPHRCSVSIDGFVTDHHPAWGSVADMMRVGKKAAGRLLDGVEHNGYPEIVK